MYIFFKSTIYTIDYVHLFGLHDIFIKTYSVKFQYAFKSVWLYCSCHSCQQTYSVLIDIDVGVWLLIFIVWFNILTPVSKIVILARENMYSGWIWFTFAEYLKHFASKIKLCSTFSSYSSFLSQIHRGKCPSFLHEGLI